MYLSYLLTPPLGQDMTQGQFLRKGLNSEFSFSYTSCFTNAEEISLPYYLPIAGGRIIGFIPFPRVLVLCQMQSVSSRVWTRVAVSISHDDNHHTTGTSVYLLTIDNLCFTKNKTEIKFPVKVCFYFIFRVGLKVRVQRCFFLVTWYGKDTQHPCCKIPIYEYLKCT